MSAQPATAAPVSILEAVGDSALFAPWFEQGDWSAWRAFLGALFGLPMADTQRRIYQACTGRESVPDGAFSEAWMVVGRRGGKSFIAALVAVFLAAFHDYRSHLQPGERGTVLIIAADRRQARTILRYMTALLEGVPMLRTLIERQTSEGIDLTTRVSIEVHTASFRSVRGYTIVAALLDEVAFWRSDESTNPDREILTAIRPGMATIPGAVLLGLSSPYARRGVLYNAWKRHHGREDSDVLVWQADTRTMNPSVPQSVIDGAYEADPAAAAAEYGAQFRSDVESFLTQEAVEACVRTEPREMPPLAGIQYAAFVDPSGGSSDAMTLGIGHREADRLIVDVVRERRPPFSPESVVAEFAELLASYRVKTVTGDRYAGEWPREQFAKRGITYKPSARPKSELYRDLLAHVNSARLDLPNVPRLVMQLVTLERRTGRGGKDSIDHAPGAHDDLANAVAGLAAELKGPGRRWRPLKLIHDASGRAEVVPVYEQTRDGRLYQH